MFWFIIYSDTLLYTGLRNNFLWNITLVHSVVSDSLRCCGLQHARLPCPSLSPRVCSDSRPLSQWQHPTTLSSAVPFPSRLRSSPAPGLPSEPALPIRRPKDWSCTISPSNEYSGLISFRIDWFDLFALQGSQESSLASQFESVNSLVLSLLYGPTLTSLHDYWKNHSFDYMDLWMQSDVSAF